MRTESLKRMLLNKIPKITDLSSDKRIKMEVTKSKDREVCKLKEIKM
jgi:hypothetical protein